MKTPLFLLPALLLSAGLSVSAQPVESTVRFRTAEGNFLNLGKDGTTVIGKNRENDKQIFTILDANGGELTDGDTVQVRTNAGGTKPSFWKADGENFGRRGQGSNFTLQKNGEKFVFKTPDGKFLGIMDEIILSLVDKAGEALKLEIVPASEKAPAEARADAK